MENIFRISLSNDDTYMRLSYKEAEVSERNHIVTYTIHLKQEEEYNIEFSISKDKYETGIKILKLHEFNLHDKAPCLIECGIKLVGEVVDCWAKNKSWKDFIACLKNKGFKLIGDTSACLTKCLL